MLNVYYSIRFWFNNNPGYYLPLAALQFHDVKINLRLNNLEKILLKKNTISDIKITELNLSADYIFLDNDERKLFAKSNHEYLIEQHQFLPEYSHFSNTNINIPLNFNHPIRQIIWTIQDIELMEKYGPLWSGQKDRINYGKIQLNGIDRIHFKPGYYFQSIQKSLYNQSIDLNKFISLINIENNNYTFKSTPLFGQLNPFCYNFSLRSTKQNQPCGSCNFSE